jgi:thiamine-monophosphate kinase
MQWVVTSDALVEGVHFLADDPADAVAAKSLRVNLSDLAAKGAVPRFYLMDLVLPQERGEPWVRTFAAGLAADQDEFGVKLIGGDTTGTPGPLTVAITALGQIAPGKMLLRSGAKAGDDVYVSGTIGDAALGLIAQRGGLNRLGAAKRKELVRRYRLPQPRTTLGPRLVDLANAAIDVSDGLVADLGHICETSNLAAAIDEASVPLSPAAALTVREHPAMMPSVLTGGDDYEILFTARPGASKAVAALARKLDLPLTRIGEMREGSGVAVVRVDGTVREIERAGWEHF